MGVARCGVRRIDNIVRRLTNARCIALLHYIYFNDKTMRANTPSTPHFFQISLKVLLEDTEGRILGLENTPDSTISRLL